MAGCEYQIEGSDKIYSESEFKKLLSEGYLDKVMMDKGIKIKGIKADEALASSFQIPSAIQPQAPTEVKSDYQIAQDATNEVSKENPDASVLLTPKGEDLSLTAVYVAKENRGKGIGTKVLESVKKQADKLGKKVVLDATTELDEETDLGRLESFYEKNGFTKVGDNKFEYNPTAEITETVTPEVKEEIGASKKIEELLPKPEKPIDKTKKGIFGKKDRTYKKRLFQYEDDLDDWNKSIKFFNNNPDAVEFYENANEEQKKYILRYSIWKSNSKDLDLNQLSEYRFIQDDGTFLISSKGFTMKINDYENAPKLKDGKLDFDKVKYDVVNPKGEVIYSSSNYDDAVSSLYEENSKYQLQKSKVSIPTETVTKAEEKVTEPTVEEKDNQKITVNPSQGYSFTYGSEQEIPNELKGVNPINRSESTVGRGKKAKTNIRLTFSGQQLIDAGLGQQESQPAPETKQPTKEAVAAKNLADFLRRGKSEKGTLMASPLPGFNQVWDATIETVAKAIEVGGVTAGNFRQSIEAGMKAFKKTDTYKAITNPKERAKISAQYKKSLVDLVPQHYNFSTDDLRNAEFETFNQKLEESKDKTLSTKEFNAIKSEAKKFVNDNLPADKYRKSEVQSYVRNNFDKAKTVEDIQKNLDKVNNIMATKEAKIQKETEKQAAKDRTSLIKNIESKIAANSKKVVSKNRRTGAKKGKITIESQQQINQIIQDLKDQGLFKNLDMLSDTELNDLNNTIDNILETGRVEQKQLEAVNDAKKRADKAIIFQALAGDSDDVLNGKEQVQERFKEANGYVIVDKQLMSSSDFKSYINKNPDTDLTDVPFYYKSESIDKVKQRLEKDSGILKAAKDGTLFNIVDLETHIKNLGAKSPELKKWLEDNIGNPIREAKRKEVESLWRETKQYKKDINKIFGTYSVKTKEFYRNKWRTKTVNIPKVYDTLVAPSDITPKNSDESLLAGEVVTLYMIVYNTNPEIKDKYKLDPKEAEKDMKTLMRENYVDPQKIYDFMHKPENKSLLDFAHFLSKKYNEDARAMFGPTIEQFHQIALGNTYYHPKIRSSSTLEPESIMNLEQDKSLSVTSPNMRHRTDNASAPFKIISAHELYLNYLKSMTHAKEYIPVVKAAQTLLTDVNKPYIMEKLGSVSDYNDMVKALSIAITDKSPFESGPMSALTNWTALTMLWFRIKSIPQQASSLVHYYTSGIKDGVMPWDILRAVPTTKEEREFSAKFYSDNPYLWTRLSGGNITPEMQKLKEQTDSLSNSLIKGTLSLARFTGLIGIKFGDFAAAATPGGGMSFALAQFKKKFKETGDYQSSRDFAIQRWMEETERTGQVSLAREIMSTQSFNTLVRLFIPFSSAQQGMGKKAYKAYLDIKDSENLTNKEYAQAIADLIYFPLLAPLPFLLTGNAGAALFRMFFDDEEDETLEDAQKKRIYHDLIFDAAQSNATALGLPGLLLNVTMNIARDRAGFNQSPSYQRLTDIGTELVSLLSSNKKWEDLSVSERKQFTKDYISENGSLKGKNIKDIYDDSIVSEKQINLLLKSIGAKNIKDLIESIKKLSKDKDFWAFFLDLETKDDKINKKLDPYFNQAVKNNKKDELYEFLSRLQRYFEDEDYKIEEYIPKEGIKTKSKRTSKFSSPKIQKPKISRPKMPKF